MSFLGDHGWLLILGIAIGLGLMTAAYYWRNKE